MLATYNDIECLAMYYYCRSIMCVQPFTGGVENLSLLFDRNARTADQLASSSALALMGDRRRRGDVDARMKVFLINFVRLHGIIFQWAKRTKQMISEVAPPLLDNHTNTNTHTHTPISLSLSSVVAEIDVSQWEDLLRVVLADLDALLIDSNTNTNTNTGSSSNYTGAFGDSLLVRLVAVCIFSVQTAGLAELFAGFVSADSKAACLHSVGETLALITLFGVVNKYVHSYTIVNICVYLYKYAYLYMCQNKNMYKHICLFHIYMHVLTIKYIPQTVRSHLSPHEHLRLVSRSI